MSGRAKIRNRFGDLAPARISRWMGAGALAGLLTLGAALPATASGVGGGGGLSDLVDPMLLLAGSRVMGVVDATPGLSDATHRLHADLAGKLSPLQFADRPAPVDPARLRQAYMSGVRDATTYGYDDVQVRGMISAVLILDRKIETLHGRLHDRLEGFGFPPELVGEVSHVIVQSGIASAQMQDLDAVATASEYLALEVTALDVDAARQEEIAMTGLRAILDVSQVVDEALLHDLNMSVLAAEAERREEISGEYELDDAEPDLHGVSAEALVATDPGEDPALRAVALEME